MMKRERGLRVAAALMLTALLVLCAAFAQAESANPIRVSSRSDPQTVVSEQDVTVTVKVFNSGLTDITGEIRLYGPDGYTVDVYEGLAGEQSVTYTGTWHVTQDQIDEGRIKYYIRYSMDEDSDPVTLTIPVAIQSEAAAPQLSATYSVSPTAAREGDKVLFNYTLSNTGNVELRNIVIENAGVTEEKLQVASLSVGERVSVEGTITMGTSELVSNPTVTYEAADSGVALTISDMARRTITVFEDALEAVLSGDGLDAVYPGEAVSLKLTLRNTGEETYSDLSVSLPDGTVAASGISLAPGKSYEGTVRYTAQGSGDVSVSVMGHDEQGESVGAQSNALTVTTQDASQALILRVRAQAQDTVIYSEPAVIRFGVVVDNIGETDATTLTVKQGSTTVATIPSLPSGESRTLVLDLQASIAGQFQFVVSGKDGSGKDRSYESNIIKVSYIEPTPAPTNTPAPTSVPATPSPEPTATPVPSFAERVQAGVGSLVTRISESVNLTVLYIIAGVLAAVIAVALILSVIGTVQRNRKLASAIDTIERTPSMRDHRGRRKRKAAGSKPASKKAGKRSASARGAAATDAKERQAAESFGTGSGHSPAAPDAPDAPVAPAESIVPTPELTEELATGAPRADEGRRRRAAQDAAAGSATESDAGAKETQAAESVADGFGHSPAAETLRVKPVEERPEFIAQGKVDDSETRVFSKSMTGSGAAASETIRLSNDEIAAMTREKDRKAAPAAKAPGMTIKTAKPMKKKKKGLFGRRDDEDDFLEEDEIERAGEDDELFE